MTIYGRFGDPLTILRRATLDDVQKFDGRKPDKRDRQAIDSGSYVIVKQNNGQERLYHVAYLKADDGSREIMQIMDRIDNRDGNWHYVKIRQHGEKRWNFLGSGGTETHLRIHAIQFTEARAQEAVAQLGSDNPSFEFKSVPIQ